MSPRLTSAAVAGMTLLLLAPVPAAIWRELARVSSLPVRSAAAVSQVRTRSSASLSVGARSASWSQAAAFADSDNVYSRGSGVRAWSSLVCGVLRLLSAQAMGLCCELPAARLLARFWFPWMLSEILPDKAHYRKGEERA